MEHAGEERGWVQRFHPRGIIFGFALGLFVLTCIHAEHQYALDNLGGHSPLAFNPENEFATFLLTIAALGLLLRRWWSHLIAIVLGGKVFYSPGYLSLWIYANVEMSGSWGFATWKKWLQWTLLTQPQYLLHTAFGGLICIYAAVALSRQIIRSNRTRANKALQLTAR
jgi:hypothetical protein